MSSNAAYDEPSTTVSVYYLRFRLRHVVGAAVHGAMHWAALQRGERDQAEAASAPRTSISAEIFGEWAPFRQNR